MENKKSCPFCGSELLRPELDGDQGLKYGYIMCDNCSAKGPDVRANYKNSDNEPWHKTAWELWNHRK